MVLVDTSVWIDHLRRTNTTLQQLLLDGLVVTHAHVIGELACGTLHRRGSTLALLRLLPRAATAESEAVLGFIEEHHLFSRGLGWTDVHLLLAASRMPCDLWTADRRLRHAGRLLHLAFEPGVGA